MSPKERAALTDRDLLERVLDEQDALRTAVTDLHLALARSHAQNTAATDRMGFVAQRHEERSDELKDAFLTYMAKAEKADEQRSAKAVLTEERLVAVERKLIVIFTACSVVGVIAGVALKVIAG